MIKLGKKNIIKEEASLEAYCICVCGCTTSDPKASDSYDDNVGEG